jgi:hypothetical protein
MEAIPDEYEIGVISLNAPNLAYQNHQPYRQPEDPAQISEAIVTCASQPLPQPNAVRRRPREKS